ncbi:diguanylate cyclase/phosphodiesterase with PAS/PAC sensor(s) [Fluviicoccus keumensis]|uniref:Diguanylate cyclase/phosphodiesterase with PAS/PAC sensor(S) n=2 Tax=Fluviicoccus keumensis TaxID=1435465 RepID=A0A4Q7ZDE7_9GAMM|nr:diguanylate cyclase/phosphodiesterase with PAS/PAC sensor(s) [Fluviicoccus keumensis]
MNNKIRMPHQDDARFRDIFETVSNVAVQGYDRHRRVIYWNPASTALYGYSREEAMGRLLEELIIPPAMRPHVIADVDRWMHQGIPIPAAELELCRKDGSTVPVFSSHTLQYNANGEPEMYCLDVDMSERKRAEQRLQDSHAELDATLQAVPDLLFELDSDGGYRNVWAHDPSLLAAQREALLGQNVRDMLPPAAAAIVMSALAEAGRQGRSQGHVIHLQLPHGECWFELSTSRKAGRDGDRFIMLSRDITTRKQAEESQRLAASVFACSQEGIVITDGNRRIVDVNPAFSRITGYSREEVLGQTPRMLGSGLHTPEFFEQLRRALDEEGGWHGELWNKRKSGEIYPERIAIDALRDSEGVIRHYVAVFSDISHLKAHEAELDRIAHYDSLTGLPNRRLLADRLALAIARSRRSGRLLAVCYLDLDGFKPVNDNHGHAAGDQLLVLITRQLLGALRGDDTVARLGGDEFVLLLNDLADIHECQSVLERVLALIATPQPVADVQVTVSASIGVALFTQEDDADADALLRHADQAMYRAKESGKNRFHIFDAEQDRRLRAYWDVVARATAGLAAGEFRLYYQPKVDMRRGEVIGVEALIRWQHPDKGLLTPGLFLPMIENSELALPLGQWVVREAVLQAAAWARQGLALPVSINVFGEQLQQEGFVDSLAAMLRDHPELRPEWIELEILETTAMEDIERVSGVIETCSRLGVSFALDDFGTGYSSLTYFRRLPTRILKIDQSFVRDMLTDPDDCAIVEAVVGMARTFGRKVIAEGVETVEHGVALLQLGCELAQGYGIARPMPADAVPDWIHHWRAPPEWAPATGDL